MSFHAPHLYPAPFPAVQAMYLPCISPLACPSGLDFDFEVEACPSISRMYASVVLAWAFCHTQDSFQDWCIVPLACNLIWDVQALAGGVVASSLYGGEHLLRLLQRLPALLPTGGLAPAALASIEAGLAHFLKFLLRHQARPLQPESIAPIWLRLAGAAQMRPKFRPLRLLRP